MGVPSLFDLFDEKNHASFPAGSWRASGGCSRTAEAVRLPLPPDGGRRTQTVYDIKVQAELQPLYDYLYGRGSFVHLDNYRPEYLPIFSRDVLRRIAAQDDSWETMVPAEVAT